MGSLRINSQVFSCIFFLVPLFFSCGLGIPVNIRRPRQIRAKIVGGNNSVPGEFPFVVNIESINLNKSFCGGAILDNVTILTAAHCLKNGSTHKCDNEVDDCFRIVAGEHNLSIHEEHEQIVNFSISDVVFHENYSDFNHINDIALINLKKPVNFTGNLHVEPILLADPQVKYCPRSYIAGWGRTTSNSSYGPITLQHALVQILSDDDCHKQWGHDYYPENMICAGTPSSQLKNRRLVPDSCYGDSGGPLMARGINDTAKWYLLGIVSWGYLCGDPEYPGVYTKIVTYLDWIRENRQSAR
ncbi:unnamed protein product [Orchesella dallaii]|uniref:Peptidase S1 domain-containing protein n=1 Tax=Orchesella dallaii TaxID=48710 RepID=A0ABP1QNP6_9HEXA